MRVVCFLHIMVRPLQSFTQTGRDFRKWFTVRCCSLPVLQMTVAVTFISSVACRYMRHRLHETHDRSSKCVGVPMLTHREFRSVLEAGTTPPGDCRLNKASCVGGECARLPKRANRS